MVGWLEIVSILFRPISLSFRLYGNVYAGENMLESMAHHGAGALLADPDPVLLYGTPGGHRAGAGLHVVDRCLYAVDRHITSRHRGAPLTNFELDRCGWTTAAAEANQPNRKNMILPLLAEMSGSIHVGLAALGAAIGVGLIGMGAASAVGRNPGRGDADPGAGDSRDRFRGSDRVLRALPRSLNRRARGSALAARHSSR